MCSGERYGNGRFGKTTRDKIKRNKKKKDRLTSSSPSADARTCRRERGCRAAAAAGSFLIQLIEGAPLAHTHTHTHRKIVVVVVVALILVDGRVLSTRNVYWSRFYTGF